MDKNLFIGREYEIRQLEKYRNSKESEFVIVYGRRRVGKTFLVIKENRKKIIFIDEIPWLDTRQSDFLAAFEGFWLHDDGRHPLLPETSGQ